MLTSAILTLVSFIYLYIIESLAQGPIKVSHVGLRRGGVTPQGQKMSPAPRRQEMCSQNSHVAQLLGGAVL